MVNGEYSMRKELKKNILVLDGHEFSALAIVRSLGKKHLNVTVASERETVQPISSFSKYAKQVVFYTNPIIEPDQFVEDILVFLKNNTVDLVIPVTEKTLIPLAKRKQEVEQFTVLAAPNENVLELVCDKNKTFALAENIGIPVPRSIVVSTLSDLDGIADKLDFPIVIKPSRSIADGKGDIRVKLVVQYAFSQQELRDKCISILPFAPVVVQEYFRGAGVGVEVLANKGEIIYAFQHKRLHELPLTGGGSCLRESVPIDPKLLDHSQKIIKALNWQGVAMIEFKHCEKTNDCRLMEINGRFWGSLPLAVNAGADFPYYLYQLLVLEEKTQAKSAAIGVKSRKLKEDIYWFLVVLFRREKSPLVVWPTASQLLFDIASVFSRRHYFDSWSGDDLKPWFEDLSRTAQWFLGTAYRPIYHLIQKAKFSWRKQVGLVRQRLPEVNHVLFLCYGNINRSVLAEKCLKHYLGNNRSNLIISSAGFHPKENRPADSEMVSVAKLQGIDLSDWVSHRVTDSMLSRADIIFVMEIKHLNTLDQQYPGYRNKSCLLGEVSNDSGSIPLEIADPYGKPLESYQRCFQQVAAACKIIANTIS